MPIAGWENTYAETNANTMPKLAACFLGLILFACLGCAVKPGMTREEVIATLGRPTAELDRNGVRRLQYSGQPMGRSVVMVDLDPNGRVMQSREVMNLPAFSAIDVSGASTRDDILWAFGPPATVDRVASWPGDIWSYRWRETQDMWFWIYFDNAGRVRRTQQGTELPTFPNDQ